MSAIDTPSAYDYHGRWRRFITHVLAHSYKFWGDSLVIRSHILYSHMYQNTTLLRTRGDRVVHFSRYLSVWCGSVEVPPHSFHQLFEPWAGCRIHKQRRKPDGPVSERCWGAEYRSSTQRPQPDVLADAIKRRGIVGSHAGVVHGGGRNKGESRCRRKCDILNCNNSTNTHRFNKALEGGDY